ncbi:MAG: hypothetical protein ACHP7P_04915 [Terriglobales bacterium]
MRTFVFGAGASLHAGYPLASEFWQKLEAFSATAEGEPYRPLIQLVKESFDTSKNFEIVMSEVDEAPATVLGQLKFKFPDLICHYFRSVRQHDAPAYRALVHRLVEPGDVLVTFNYDLALDRELRKEGKWAVHDGYGFGIELPDERSPTKLLKLHGSSNWITLLFGGVTSGVMHVAAGALSDRPVIAPDDFTYLGYEGYRDPLFRGGGYVRPMILPTANKRFYVDTSFCREMEAFWDSIWDQATAALASSTQIWIVGYSLPRFDERARNMLLTAPERSARIQVCCHRDSSRICDEFRRAGYSDVAVVAGGSFEDLVLRS